MDDLITTAELQEQQETKGECITVGGGGAGGGGGWHVRVRLGVLLLFLVLLLLRPCRDGGPPSYCR